MSTATISGNTAYLAGQREMFDDAVPGPRCNIPGRTLADQLDSGVQRFDFVNPVKLGR